MSPKLVFGSPVASDGPEDHADWLEVLALLSADGDSSYQDLVSELRRAGTLDAVGGRNSIDQGSERSQQLADEAFAQLDLRSKSCGEGYPFKVGDQTLSLDSDASSASSYVFMLLLKVFGVRTNPRGIRGTGLFELLATLAAATYLDGSNRTSRSYHFGFPRKTTPAGFRDALDDLCKELGEGGGSKARPSRRNQKDAKLDLVAWRPFPDGRNGKLIAFGQCAAGDHWDGKVTELSPTLFTGLWMNANRLAFAPMVFFFIPRCLNDEEWESVTMTGNTVLFDRCRIAALLSETNIAADLDKRISRWIAHLLKQIEQP